MEPTHQHWIVRRRSDIYLVILMIGLLMVAIVTRSYSAGFSLFPYIWAFPAGWLQLFGASADLTWLLIVGYLVYLITWLGLTAAKRTPTAAAILTAHLLLVMLTVGGCHRVISQLPH